MSDLGELGAATEDPAVSVKEPVGRGPRILTWGLALVAAIVAGVASLGHRNANADEDARSAALKVGRTSVVELLSYTPSDVTKNLDSESELLSGKFRRDYRQLVTKDVAPAAQASKVTAQAEVQAVGISSSSTDRVVLLMFVNVSTAAAGSTQPEVRGSRITVTMDHKGGRWLISGLDAL